MINIENEGEVTRITLTARSGTRGEEGGWEGEVYIMIICNTDHNFYYECVAV